MKGMVCPEQINETSLLCYDDFNEQLFESLPDFLKDKIKISVEYNAMMNPSTSILKHVSETVSQEGDDLPF